MTDIPANPVEKPGYKLEFADEFDGPELDGDKWLPFHLPQWSSRAAAKANYRFADGNLVLSIGADQQPWCPEFDGDTKVSSLQTGVFSGPAGSGQGQHRFKPEVVVREAQETEHLYAPQFGYFETRLKAVASPTSVVALWMIGFEDEPERSGEILICEIKGAKMAQWTAEVCYGVRAWGDAKLQDAIFEDEVIIDAREFHIYAVEWTPKQISFFIDNKRTRMIAISPQYPMQFMLGIYDKPALAGAKTRLPDAGYPKELVVDYFRAYQFVRDEKVN